MTSPLALLHVPRHGTCPSEGTHTHTEHTRRCSLTAPLAAIAAAIASLSPARRAGRRQAEAVCARYTWGPLREPFGGDSVRYKTESRRRRRARCSSRWHVGCASSRAGGEHAGVLAGAYLKISDICLSRSRTTAAPLPLSSTTSSAQIVGGADDDERGVRSWHVGCPSGRAGDVHAGVLT